MGMIDPETQLSSPVLAFAREEWKRLAALRPSGAIPGEVSIGTWSDAAAVPSDIEEKMKRSVFADDYFILDEPGRLALSGKSERAALYAVYQYAREAWGLRTAYPGTDAVFAPPATAERGMRPAARFYSPRFERRGFVIENYRDPDYLKLLIDWLPKNGQNEIFFTFMLWDAVRDMAAPEIAKRGLRVTLGGHSMKFFSDRAESFRLMQGEHPYTAKKQFDYSDESWFPSFFEQVADYCKDVPNLATLSLWPEDLAEGSGKGFLGAYVRFAERLQAYMAETGIDVEVEHIAYNAGLSWDMLELDGEARASERVDTLFAYWGRDYRFGYDASPREQERRAERSLEAWAEAVRGSGRKLTIFEYYSDHFMLSALFPPLPRRIADDIAYYEKLGADGIVNLIVPYKGPMDYPWQWAHGFNSFIFARTLWGESLDSILEEYGAEYPASERAATRAWFERLEEPLAEATHWNVPLFPARAVDVDRAAATREQADAVVGTLQRIRAALSPAPATSDARLAQWIERLLEQAETLERQWREKRDLL